MAARTMPLLTCDGGQTTVVLAFDDQTLLAQSVAVTVGAGLSLHLRLRTAAGVVRVDQVFGPGTTTVPFAQTGANRNFMTRWAASGFLGLGWETQ